MIWQFTFIVVRKLCWNTKKKFHALQYFFSSINSNMTLWPNIITWYWFSYNIYQSKENIGIILFVYCKMPIYICVLVFIQIFMHGDKNIVTQNPFFFQNKRCINEFCLWYVTKISNLIVYTKFRYFLLPFDLK